MYGSVIRYVQDMMKHGKANNYTVRSAIENLMNMYLVSMGTRPAAYIYVSNYEIDMIHEAHKAFATSFDYLVADPSVYLMTPDQGIQKHVVTVFNPSLIKKSPQLTKDMNMIRDTILNHGYNQSNKKINKHNEAFYAQTWPAAEGRILGYKCSTRAFPCDKSQSTWYLNMELITPDQHRLVLFSYCCTPAELSKLKPKLQRYADKISRLASVFFGEYATCNIVWRNPHTATKDQVSSIRQN